MPTLSTQTTPYYGGGQVQNPANVILVNGAPSIHHVEEKLGTLAVQNDTGSIYCLSSKVGGTATWTALGAGSSDVDSLTGNSGGAIAPVGGNIILSGGGLANFVGSGNTLTLTSKANGFPVTQYVVGSTESAGYATIQAAVTAANSAGGGIVVVQPGDYTENLTLYDGVHITGLTFADAGGGVNITGVHTPPVSGGFTFNNVRLISATNIFQSSAAGTAHLVLGNAEVFVTNGYTFNLPNWTGKLESFDVNAAVGTNDGYVNNTGGAEVDLFEVSVGSGTANAMIVSGSTIASGANIYCPINFVTGSTFQLDSGVFGGTVTFLNNSTGAISNSRFDTGLAPAVVMSSTATVRVSNSIISSDNDPVIDGAGTGALTLSAIVYTILSVVAPALNVHFDRTLGMLSNYTVGTTGAYSTIQNVIDTLKTGNPGFGPHVIYVQSGLYAENLDFTGFEFNANFHIRGCALNAKSSIDGTTIFGNITPPDGAGRILFEDINLVASSGDVISSTVAGQADILLRNCNSNTTSGGYIINVPNWTASSTILIQGHQESATGVACAGVITGAANVTILDCVSFGTATGGSSVLTGNTDIRNSNILCPITFGTGSQVTVSGSVFNNPILFSGNSTGIVQSSIIRTGAAAAITMSSSAAVSIENSVITSSNNPAIAGSGAGVLTFGNVDFTSNALTAGTLTLSTSNVSKSGNLQALGNVICSTAGKGVQVKSGSNARIGVGSVLVGGTLAIANTSVTTNTVVMVSVTTLGTVTTAKAVHVTKSAGVGFTVTSADATDTSTFDWYLVEAV